jgi:predicted nucleotidyltransferase component of viral defense system
LIPRDYITEWRAQAPWVQDAQVEQDLVISRALVALFEHPLLGSALAFRGGTALFKLYLLPPARYSEDIDLVQVEAAPAGDMLDAIREVIDPWLGKANWKQSERGVSLFYRFESEDTPPIRLRLKIEINTREHFNVFGIQSVDFGVDSRWFTGATTLQTYQLDELLGTKLRALYQRRKGRDLFDLALGLELGNAEPTKIVATFIHYLEQQGQRVTRAEFEANLAQKLTNSQFVSDLTPLLASGTQWQLDDAVELISTQLIALLPAK